VGLQTFATVEDPQGDVDNPRFAKTAARAKKNAQRSLARKKPGSNHRARAQRCKARIDAKIADQRRDFHHKQASKLVMVYDRIGVEDLKVKNMSRRANGRRKAGLNRSIADAGWTEFLRVLAWQAAKAGKAVVISQVKDSTQRCSSCGAKAKPRIELSDREFRCRTCGLVCGRDRNAAKNLNPDRPPPGGGTEPPGTVAVGDDGSKTPVSADAEAA
jgi:putative transposase